MSALPKSEPKLEDPTAEPADAEGWALLEGLRRRLDDHGVQGRKTQQQVTQLAESIGALVESQRRRSRWLNINSFVAYLIFTILCGAGFYFVYATRADALLESRNAAKRERDAAVKRADAASAKLAEYEAADRVARDKQAQAVAVDAALKSAVAAFKAGRHADAIPQLEAALAIEPSGARAGSMRYYLGVAYAKTGQLDNAIAHLTTALEVESEHADVRFQLASALDRSGQYPKARGEYDRFATAHPQSAFAAFAMRRSATLARMPAKVVAPTAPGGAPPPSAMPATGAPPKPAPNVAPNAAAPTSAANLAPNAAPKPAPKRAWKPAWKPAPKKPVTPTSPTDSEAPPSPLPPPSPSPSSPSPSSTDAEPLSSQPSTDAEPLSTTPSTGAEPLSSSHTAPLSTSRSTPPKNADRSKGDKARDDLPALPKPIDPPSSMPAPQPWPSQPEPPDRAPAPEVTTPTTPPPPAPPPIDRLAAPPPPIDRLATPPIVAPPSVAPSSIALEP